MFNYKILGKRACRICFHCGVYTFGLIRLNMSVVDIDSATEPTESPSQLLAVLNAAVDVLFNIYFSIYQIMMMMMMM